MRRSSGPRFPAAGTRNERIAKPDLKRYYMGAKLHLRAANVKVQDGLAPLPPAIFAPPPVTRGRVAGEHDLRAGVSVLSQAFLPERLAA